MDFVQPGILDFFTRYPEFRDFDQDWVQAVLDEASNLVGEGWIPKYRRPAILALTAHMVLTQQNSAPVTSDVSGGTTTGPIQSETVGPLSINYKRPVRESSASSGTASAADLNSTAYGVMYQQLLTMGIPSAILVV